MGTLIRMKAEVHNNELPVVTEQGVLPYYTGIYVNKLADAGLTLSQTEINAINTLINDLRYAGVLDKIDSFYPFMENPNIPLIGDKELAFTNITPTNNLLDYSGDKLRGIKGWVTMNGVKYSELSTFNKGFVAGGSIISKTLSSHPTNTGVLFKLLGENPQNDLPNFQYRLAYSSYYSSYRFLLYDFYDSTHSMNIPFSPNVPDSDTQKNYVFIHGSVDAEHTSDARGYVSALKINNESSITDSGQLQVGLQTTNLTNHHVAGVGASENVQDRVLTTIAFFNEIISKAEANDFCDALNTFATAVGKTVSVG